MAKLYFPKIDWNSHAKMYLIKNDKNKNILATPNPKNGVSFWNFLSLKHQYDLDYEWDTRHFCQISGTEIILGGMVYEGIANKDLIKYDLKEKKIILEKHFDFLYKNIEYLKEKNIILISGTRPKSEIFNNIYIFNTNFVLIQNIENSSNYGTIEGFNFYQKNEKEEFLFFYVHSIGEWKEINFLTFY